MLLRIKKILFPLCVLFTIGVNAQKEAANWYFGSNAGVQFDIDSGTVTPLSNGALSTEEGCTSISDTDGNLLFYTDGRTVYNASHDVMLNGSGLKGDASSTQSALIVPKPNDDNLYYIFTVDTPALDNIDTGFNYFEVNMTLDGGLGGVVDNTGTQLLSNTSEKLSAVLKDCETQDIWVITFADINGGDVNNSFFAYRVTELGVTSTPVISTFNINITEIRGYLKFSPSGKQIACANVGQGLLLLDFDLETGIASNLQNITPNVTSNNGSPQQAYGVEFSPNNELLYVSTYFSTGGNSDDPNNQYGALLQYNLKAENIDASEIVIDERQTYRGGLQLGPDGKLYRAMSDSYSIGSPFLSVVDAPNTIGTNCNYQHNAIALIGESRQGLPPFITSFFSEDIDIIQNGASSTSLAICDGDVYTLMADDITGAVYSWYKDGLLLSESDFDLEVSASGFYEVFIELSGDNCGTLEGEATVIINPLPEVFDSEIYQCDDQDMVDGFTTFNLNEVNASLTGNATNRSTNFFLTLNDAQNNTNAINGNAYSNVSNPQTVYVRVTNDLTGCINFTTLTLETSDTQINNYTAPPVCDELGSEDGKNTFNLDDFSSAILNGLPDTLTIAYYETANDALLENNPLPSNYENTAPYSHTIYVRVENDNACYGINEVLLTIHPLPDLQDNETLFYCLNKFPETITLDAGLNGANSTDYSFSWSNSQHTETTQVNTVGTYTVIVTNNETRCEKTRTLVVEPSNIATIENIEIIDGSLSNNQVTIVTIGEGDYVYALVDEDGVQTPFQESPIFSQLRPGFYSIVIKDIKNNCGITTDMVSLIGFPQYFTPNNDGQNDLWQVYGVSKTFQPNTEIFIYDRYGKLLAQISASGQGWDGTFNGNLMPTNDYWFTVKLQDGRTYRNHFTLKR